MYKVVDELLDNLNDSQKEAVKYNEGPSLVIAGAGSGKTRVLTHKVAYLLKSGMLPWNIMALTFTNKAAREMKERIAKLVDPVSASRLWMGTFHSIFLRILRVESECIGFPSNFTIYDTTDSKNLIKSIIKEMNLDDKVYKVSSVQGRISAAKNDLVSPEAYASDPNIQVNDIHSKRPLLKEIYKRYTERCRMASAMDFDDILMMTNILFRDHPEILATYQERFSFILVDEYQDTNFSQYLIVKKLSEKHHHVCVVGDDSQSIYSFRGANIENILNFRNTYPESKIFKLEQNYRSTKNIVNAANSLISKNKAKIQKKIFSENDLGSRLKVLCAYSDIEEGFIVANKISEMRLSTFDSFNDFAILYRTNAQSRIFEESLRKRNLPYRVYGGLSFYQRKEIKDIIAYLRLILNPDDEEAFKRIVNYPARGIGETTQLKLTSAATANATGIGKIIEDPLAYKVQINAGTARKVHDFWQLINSFILMTPEKNVYELTEQLIRESGILNDVGQDTTAENLSRKENIQELLSGMYEFVGSRLEEGNESVYLGDYLSEVSLLTDQDEEKASEGEKITLMTIHAAKGLEFKNVFIVGLEEEIFPSSHCLDSEKALEEERRLLYVAITRAERNCVLSYAKSRFRNGQNNFTKPSRFLGDLDPSFLEMPSEASLFSSASRANMDFSQSDPDGWGEKRSGYSRLLNAANRYSNEKNTVYAQQNQSNISNGENQLENGSLSRPVGKRLVKLEKCSPSKTADKHVTTEYNGQNIRIGQTILHERFGKGTVTQIEGNGSNCTMNVEFENSGNKRLLLKFARFTLLD